MEKTDMRKAYLAGEITHAEFYRSVCAEAGISYKASRELPRIKAALEAGDEHLNSIPLIFWDQRSLASRTALDRALKAHGDFWSLAGGCCAHKQAARDAAQ